MEGIYLDWAATSPPSASCQREALELSLSVWGNPSSKHAAGARAKEALEVARKRIAIALGAGDSRVVFTSGATESNNIALAGLLKRPVRGGRILTTGIEHPSAYKPLAFLEKEGFKVSALSARKGGLVEVESLGKGLDGESILVSVMAVNNETGAIQPVEAMARALRGRTGGRAIQIHCDAVQALGKVSLDYSLFDSLSLSAHKVGGPRGAGILLARKSFDPLYSGGDQEGGMRPGTEGLFGAWASMLSIENACSSLESNREKAGLLEAGLFSGIALVPGLSFLPRERCSPGDPRFSPFIFCLALDGIPGEVAVRAFAEEGIMLSSGSACSSGKRDLRVVLESGISKEDAQASFRLSIGPGTKAGDIDAFLETANKIRSRMG